MILKAATRIVHGLGWSQALRLVYLQFRFFKVQAQPKYNPPCNRTAFGDCSAGAFLQITSPKFLIRRTMGTWQFVREHPEYELSTIRDHVRYCKGFVTIRVFYHMAPQLLIDTPDRHFKAKTLITQALH